MPKTANMDHEAGKALPLGRYQPNDPFRTTQRHRYCSGPMHPEAVDRNLNLKTSASI